MFRPYIQRTNVLALLAAINVLIVYFSMNYKNSEYRYKVKAANIMTEFLEEISLKDSIPLSNLSQLSLVGTRSSSIRTNPGSKLSKVTTLNPQFASLIVDMFFDMNLQGGDTIAASITGSFPGANLAFFAATKAMDIHPIIISSIGSSSFGATNIDFTWIDIQDFLFKKGYKNVKSAGISLGGESDLGSSFSNQTIETLIGKSQEYTENYSSEFLYNSEYSLVDQIDSRYKLYNDLSPVGGYSAFINIGGGSASVGLEPSLQAGVNTKLYQTDDCLAFRFYNKNVIVGNINDIEKLTNIYGITYGDLNIPATIIDNELMIYNNQYDLLILFLGLIACFGVLVYTGKKSYSQIRSSKVKEDDIEVFL